MRIRSRIVLALVVAAFACTRIQTAYAFGPENDGTTTMLPVGSEIRLVLPADFEWNIEATDPKALQLKTSVAGTVGDSGVRIWAFDVTKSGRLVVRATGE